MNQFLQREDVGTTVLPRAIWRPVWAAGVTLLLLLLSVMFWARHAELVTTFRVPGVVTSPTPSHEVHHRFGGRIAKVLVSRHAQVGKGQVLVRLDVDAQRQEVRVIEEQIAVVRAENRELRSRLELLQTRAGAMGDLSPARRAQIAAEFAQQDAAENAALAVLEAAQVAARAKERTARAELAALEGIRDLISDRIRDQLRLSKKGAVTLRDLKLSREQHLKLKSEIAGTQRLIATLTSEAERAALSAEQNRQDLRSSQNQRLNRNEKLLLELQPRLNRLQQEIASADVRAPVAGMLTNLPYRNAEMVLPPGGVVAEIALPLETPLIEMRVPPRFVDQVKPGRLGKAVLDGLPVREMPELSLSVVAVSSEAVEDPQGNPLYYLATAQMDKGDLDKARQALGERFRLALDMPVTATLSGDSTTFLSFLARPILSMRKTAFEAG